MRDLYRSLGYHWGTAASVFGVLSFKMYNQGGDFIGLYVNNTIFSAFFLALSLKSFWSLNGMGFSGFSFLYSSHLVVSFFLLKLVTNNYQRYLMALLLYFSLINNHLHLSCKFFKTRRYTPSLKHSFKFALQMPITTSSGLGRLGSLGQTRKMVLNRYRSFMSWLTSRTDSAVRCVVTF